jgi:predicted dienelactone hydrolase
MDHRHPLAFFALALCLSVGLVACAGDALYRQADNSAGVETRDFVLSDELHARDVPLHVHVPVGFEGPLPLVVYSHGSGCGPVNYDRITRHWAKKGYVVIAPTHIDGMENAPVPTPDQYPTLLSRRVRDPSFVLDALDRIESELGKPGLIDRERVAIGGHSFGGMISQIKVGMPLKPGSYVFPGQTADPRFRAAVVMSGVGQMPMFTDDAFDFLTGPVIATGGTLDVGNVGTGEIFPWQWRVAAYDLAPPGDKYRVVLDEGDHYLGGLICRADRGGPDDPEGVAILQATTTAFLDAYLLGDETARDYLATTDLSDMTGGRGNPAAQVAAALRRLAFAG